MKDTPKNQILLVRETTAARFITNYDELKFSLEESFPQEGLIKCALQLTDPRDCRV
jgi:hypothetical protein